MEFVHNLIQHPFYQSLFDNLNGIMKLLVLFVHMQKHLSAIDYFLEKQFDFQVFLIIKKDVFQYV